jgi:hypothetical protein
MSMYACYGCGDVCVHAGKLIQYEWQKFCSRSCFLDRWFHNQNERINLMLKLKRNRAKREGNSNE